MPQDKQNEINLEIPFMGDYYSGADITFVLSDAEYTLHEDLTRWCDIMDNAMERGKEITEEEDMWILSHHDDNVLDISEDVWFTRIWTFQEAVFSKTIIIADVKRLYIRLSEILGKIMYAAGINIYYVERLFANSMSDLLSLCDSIHCRQVGESDLVSAGNMRNCYMAQDKFYGALGVLGYKDFPIDYDISVEELNKKIIQYAYSKGDISWIGIGGSNGLSFIQPPNQRLVYISEWKEEPKTCNIVFENDALYINVLSLATVVHCENFVVENVKEGGFIEKLFGIFRDWGFDDNCIVQTLTGFAEISHELHETAKIMFGCDGTDEGYDRATEELCNLFEEADKYILEISRVIVEIMPVFGTTTIAKIKLGETGENIPIIISGSANIGDEIKLLRMYDDSNRSLGIVCNSGKHKGACTYKRTNAAESSYISYKLHI